MGPDELMQVIGDSPFFGGLEPEERMVFAREGRLTAHEPGDPLFDARMRPDSLWLVVHGLVEICRREDSSEVLEAVAYMGPGAVLGENKIITGTPYRSMARFPEGGTTLRWSRNMILRRLGSSSHFSLHYLHHLARRLEGTFDRLGRRGAKLEGQLDHFDLETILQTVVGSAATGVLEISDDSGAKVAAVYTDQGLVGPIHCGNLRGEEAFLEILIQRPDKGTFCYTPLPEARETEELLQLQHLLIESARISDECQRFVERVPEGALFHPIILKLQWANSADATLHDRVWHIVGATPSSVDELVEQVPFSRARVCLVLKEMVETGELWVEGLSSPSGSWVAEGL